MNISIEPSRPNRITEPLPVGASVCITPEDSNAEIFEWTVALVRYVRKEGRLPVIPGDHHA